MKKISPSAISVRLHKESEVEALIVRIKQETRNEILSEIKKDKGTSKKDYVSHNVQILILHYLGIGNELDTNVEKAKLYASLINRDEEVTRQKLSSIETFKTEKNLKFLLEYFEAIGFEDQISTIKKESEKKN